jgi:hypothetical protein
MSLDELEKAMKSWPYPWPDYLELIQKVRDEAVTTAMTDQAKAKTMAGYSDRLNGCRAALKSDLPHFRCRAED